MFNSNQIPKRGLIEGDMSVTATSDDRIRKRQLHHSLNDTSLEFFNEDFDELETQNQPLSQGVLQEVSQSVSQRVLEKVPTWIAGLSQSSLLSASQQSESLYMSTQSFSSSPTPTSINTRKRKTPVASKNGRTDLLSAQVWIKRIDPKDNKEKLFCRGHIDFSDNTEDPKGCSQKWVHSDPLRIKRHASNCLFLPEELRLKIQENQAAQSLSESVKSSNIPLTNSARWMRAHLNKSLTDQYDLAIFKCFVCCSIPISILDNPMFKHMIATLTGNIEYIPPSSTRFTSTLLPRETQHAKSEIKKMLQKERHLTHSFDGWTTRANQSIYTSTTTLIDGRSFTIAGHEYSKESHTGLFLADLQIKVRFENK